jgi:hypothetical protein
MYEHNYVSLLTGWIMGAFTIWLYYKTKDAWKQEAESDQAISAKQQNDQG